MQEERVSFRSRLVFILEYGSIVLIVEEPIVTVKRRTAIDTLFLCFWFVSRCNVH